MVAFADGTRSQPPANMSLRGHVAGAAGFEARTSY
jgi:hypothetical protein